MALFSDFSCVSGILLMALFSDFSCRYWVGKEGRSLRLVKSFRRVENLPERVKLLLPGGVMVVNRCLLGYGGYFEMLDYICSS